MSILKLITFFFCFGSIFLIESIDCRHVDLCDTLLIKMMLWPCDCRSQQPNRLTCSGFFVSDRSLKRFEHHVKRLPNLKRLFNRFNQIEITNTRLTEFNIRNMVDYFPMTDFHFKSNRYLREIRLGSNRTLLKNLFIENMPNVNIDE